MCWYDTQRQLHFSSYLILKVSQPTKSSHIFEPLLTKFESDCYVLHGVLRGFACRQIADNYHKDKTGLNPRVPLYSQCKKSLSSISGSKSVSSSVGVFDHSNTLYFAVDAQWSLDKIIFQVAKTVRVCTYAHTKKSNRIKD